MDEIKEYFEQNGSLWVNNNYGKNAEHYPVGENRLRLLMEMLDNVNISGKDVLDIGSGGGNISFELASKGYNVIGIDRSQSMVTIAFDKKEQLDLRTPGSIPSFASSRKHIRQRPKSLIYACPREQRKQRFVSRVLNFDFFKCLTVTDVFAIYY